MKPRQAIAVLTLLTFSWSAAQNVALEPAEDPVQAAISEFNRRDSGKSNEVTVVLDPVGVPPAPVSTAAVKPEAAAVKTEEAVLVTGKPPEGTDLVKEETMPAVPEMVMEQSATEPQKGLAVHVEKIQSGTGPMDPSKVKLLAPFPAKLLSPAPVGWRLESSEHAPPFTREVELSPGKKITLKVRPHLLVPDADGAGVFNVAEPGFDSSLGYRQDATVGAVLSTSIRQLDNDSKQLGTAIENLQQLLVSLPKPEPPPPPVPAATPAPNRKR